MLSEVASRPVSVGASFTPTTLIVPVIGVASFFAPPVPLLPPSFRVTVKLRVG